MLVVVGAQETDKVPQTVEKIPVYKVGEIVVGDGAVEIL